MWVGLKHGARDALDAMTTQPPRTLSAALPYTMLACVSRRLGRLHDVRQLALCCCRSMASSLLRDPVVVGGLEASHPGIMGRAIRALLPAGRWAVADVGTAAISAVTSGAPVVPVVRTLLRDDLASALDQVLSSLTTADSEEAAATCLSHAIEMDAAKCVALMFRRHPMVAATRITHPIVHRACFSGAARALEELLNADGCGLTPGLRVLAADSNAILLTTACMWGHADVVRVLVDHRPEYLADCDVLNSGLVLAAQGNHCDVAEVLLQIGASCTWDALLQACRAGSADVTELLVDEARFPPGGRELGEALTSACTWGRVNVAHHLLERGASPDHNGGAPILWACRSGYNAVLSLLLLYGADIAAVSPAALYAACRCGSVDVVSTLIDHGVDVHAGNDRCIRIACSQGNLDLMRLLISRGIDVRANNDDALIAACHNSDVAAASLLLDHGADLHVGQDEPLRIACCNGNAPLVSLLIQRGADIHAFDDGPLRVACRECHFDVIDLLLRHRGN